MTWKSAQLRRGMIAFAILCAGIFVFMAVATWPSMFVSEVREVFGRSFTLQKIDHFEDVQVGFSREGSVAWIYGIAERDAAVLIADKESLRRYPMWSALAFDGYKRVRWQTVDELRNGPDFLLADAVLSRSSTILELDFVGSLTDAQDLARGVARQRDVLVCGWYTESGGVVTNYNIWILNLQRRLIIRLHLST